MSGLEALLLRGGEYAGSGNQRESECEGHLAEHGDVSLIEFVGHTVLVCTRIMLASKGSGKSARRIARCDRRNAGAERESACLPEAFCVGRDRKQGGCFGLGNEVLLFDTEGGR